MSQCQTAYMVCLCFEFYRAFVRFWSVKIRENNTNQLCTYSFFSILKSKKFVKTTWVNCALCTQSAILLNRKTKNLVLIQYNKYVYIFLFSFSSTGSSAFKSFMGSSGSGSNQHEPTLNGIWGELNKVLGGLDLNSPLIPFRVGSYCLEPDPDEPMNNMNAEDPELLKQN